MRLPKEILIFAISMLLSQSGILAPWYCNLFLRGNAYATLRFDKFFEEKIGANYRYFIPVSELAKDLHGYSAISLGIIRPKASISCGNSKEELRAVPGLQNVDIPNAPINVDFEKYPPCRDFIQVEINANSVSGPHHSGIIVIGSQKHVSAINDFITIFNDRIRLILTFVVALTLFVNTRNRLLGIATPFEKAFSPNLILWSAFLGISSGIIPALIPFPVSREVFMTALYSTSALCHLGPLTRYLTNRSGLNKFYWPISFMTIIPILLLEDGGNIYSIIGVIMSIVTLVIIVAKDRTLGILGFYCFALILNFIKIGASPIVFAAFLPHWHFASVFIGVFLIDLSIRNLRRNALIFRALEFIHAEMKEEKQNANIDALLAAIQSVLKCKRVSLLKINRDNSCTVFLGDVSVPSVDVKSIQLNTFPPIFSHSITTRKSLFHISNQTNLWKRLNSRYSEELTAHQYFSIIPLIGRSGELGAIACTGYEIDLEDELSTQSFESAFRIISGYVTKILELNLNNEKIDASKVIEEATRSLCKVESLDNSAVIGEVLHEFACIFNYKGFLGIVNPNRGPLKILATFGLSASQKSAAESLNLKADDTNEVGPIPLAIRSGEPTFVNEVGLVKGLLTQKSAAFLDLTNSSSIAVVPFDFSGDPNNGSSRFIFYLISESRNAFDDYAQTIIRAYTESLRLSVEKIKLFTKSEIAESRLQATQESLGHFVPQHLIPDFLAGKEISEVDHGFLVMFDLKGSTRLSITIRETAFHDHMKALKDDVVAKLSLTQWKLQQFIWDGFELTYTSAPEMADKIEVQPIVECISEIFSKWKISLIEEFGHIPEIEALSYRLCFTYGDTSRGIVRDGTTQKWALTGNAVAVASKVEQAVKKYPGQIFCDATMIGRTLEVWNFVEVTTHGIEVFSLGALNSDLQFKHSA